MPFVTLAGQRIHYTHSLPATPPATLPLVLVHGAGGNLYHWPPHLRRLAGVETYALDLPGHGRSEGPGRSTIEAYAAVITNFAAALDLPRFVLAGHSMGAAIALTVGLHHAEQLVGLVLVGAGARLRVSPAILDGLQTDFATTTAQLVEWMYHPTFPAKWRQQALTQLRADDPQLLYQDFLACNGFDLRTQVASLRLPTLIICGVADKMTPIALSEGLQQAIVGSALHPIAQAGHMVMLEQPAAVTDLFGAFMRRENRAL